MSLLEAMIGSLAPVACLSCGIEGAALCQACRFSEIIPYGERCFNCGRLSPACRTCPACRRTGAPAHVWVATDHDGVAKALIAKYKFEHQRAVAKDVAKIMAAAFLDQGGLLSKNLLISYVPTANRRVRQRGFDHAQLLAESVAQQLNLPWGGLLRRIGDAQQVGATKAARRRQAEGAYSLKAAAQLNRRHILLVDDVVTTGTTLSQCAKVLRKGGARQVDALVFAKRI
jgi:competence protein ComFC